MEGTKIKIPARKKARVEIIPLIDVIFFLLATFVLFTLSLNRIQSVPVDLPVAKPNSDPQDNKDSVTIQVSADNSLFWNREPMEMSDLPSRITAYKSQTEDPKILIAGDEKARFGATVQVLDEVRKAGILKFSVETRTRPTGK
ncbi:biopolymer transporter ExbD [Opitutus sp. GAS368]|jgi:biopolymer transport protein ExbD|uniref:ExbD/TolR family protein n=1 Tax=Opitutus sp. GAS368 TaxID=1882749 RepID=UPI0008796F9F|nr:biopolymer transporter ExbD [Opitutus sp. GAS368]SDS34022.1 outer membrane transport energization protein ExbD [Opitutus sp. GAS368]